MSGACGPTDADWQSAVDLLGHAREVVLVAHVGPDGDALGSVLALRLGLLAQARPPVVHATVGDLPVRLPPAYTGLAGATDLVGADALPSHPELVVALDCASPDRLGAALPTARAAGTLLVVDHHASTPPFGAVNLIDPKAPATVVLVAALLDRLGVALTAEMAAALYTGLVTDTGSFRFAATTADTHTLAARLLSAGIDHAAINQRIWDTTSFGFVRVLGAALSRAVLEPDAVAGHGLVWTTVTRADLTAYGVSPDRVEGVVDGIRTTAEADVAVACIAVGERRTRVSMRSRGAVDVGAVCTALGGGGHRLAAGFSCDRDLPATVALVRERLE